jgi:hypothetical protein
LQLERALDGREPGTDDLGLRRGDEAPPSERPREEVGVVSTIGGVRADLTKPRAGRLPGSSPSTVALTRWSARAALVFSGLRSELIGVATSSS